MKKILSFIALAMLTLSVSAQTTWDFSILSDNDKALLDGDQTNWTYDAANQRYANTADYLPAGESLKAGGQELAITKGLLFTAAKKDRIRISVKDNYRILGLNDVDMTVTIPGLKKGQRIEVIAKTGKSTEAHGLAASNVKADEGSFVNSMDKLTNSGEVMADGDVVLTTTAGAMVIYSITVSETETPITPLGNVKWDFANIGDNDLANLQTDQTSWTYDEANQRYINTENYLPNAEILKANGQVIALTDGLYMTAAKKDRIRISVKDSYRVLQLNGDAMTITIKGVTAGQKILIDAKTAKSGEARGITASNVTPAEGSFIKSEDRLSHIGTVIADGEVTITTDGGGMSFYSIEVGDKIGTGIKDVKQGCKANDGKLYNLSGMEVKEPATGILIQNGKKYIKR